MEEFVRNYGIWILLAAVFMGVHWLGGCGRHHGDATRNDGAPGRREDERTPRHLGGGHP